MPETHLHTWSEGLEEAEKLDVLSLRLGLVGRPARDSYGQVLGLEDVEMLLQALATRSRDQCRMRSDPKGPLLIRLTDPIPLQKRAMELWRAFPVNNTPNPAKTPW